MNAIIEKIRTWVNQRKKALHSTLFNDEYNDFLSFLSDLEKEEKPSKGLEEEIERYLHSLGVGYGGWVDGMEDDDLRGIARHFAKWQKEQMMKEAVEGEIVSLIPERNYVKVERESIAKATSVFKEGDKVSIIIVKED